MASQLLNMYPHPWVGGKYEFGMGDLDVDPVDPSLYIQPG
jgi:hypothetical protein